MSWVLGSIFQVVACCLAIRSHYPKQHWLTVNWTVKGNIKNVKSKKKKKKDFKHAVCRMAAICWSIHRDKEWAYFCTISHILLLSASIEVRSYHNQTSMFHWLKLSLDTDAEIWTSSLWLFGGIFWQHVIVECQWWIFLAQCPDQKTILSISKLFTMISRLNSTECRM